MKRALSFSLALTMLTVTACGGGSAAVETTTAAPDTTTAPAETTVPELEAVDYGGEEIVFLTYKNSDYQNSYMDIRAEEINGDYINDAVFNRNKLLEEKYNIAISSNGETNGGYAVGKNSVLSGDGAFDIFLLSAQSAHGGALDGILLDMNTLDHIDVTKPWWNSRIAEQTSILGSNYYYVGDMNLDTWTQSYVTYFNKKLAEEYKVGDLYETVRAGKWIFDELDRLTRTVYQDLNGNGEYDENDLYGLAACSVCIDCFWASSGVSFIGKKDGDELELTLGEKFYDMYDKMVALLEAPEMLYTDRPQYTSKRDTYDRGAFIEDRALFFIEGLCVAENKLREMESDYGIIPIPKYSEEQENYSVYSHLSHNSTISVPITGSKDADMLARIIEDMARFSAETVRPAYYEKMLNGKLARAEEDVEMLEIITSNTTYELGFLVLSDFLHWQNGLRNAVSTSSPAASYVESKKTVNEEAINKVMESIRANKSA